MLQIATMHMLYLKVRTFLFHLSFWGKYVYAPMSGTPHLACFITATVSSSRLPVTWEGSMWVTWKHAREDSRPVENDSRSHPWVLICIPLCRSAYLESEESLHFLDLILEKSSRLLRSLEPSSKPIEPAQVFLYAQPKECDCATAVVH